MRRTCLALLLVLTAAAAQSPDPAAQLARVQAKVARALGDLPDYTCMVSAQRAVWSQRRKRFAPVDIVRYEIAQVGGRELFAWPGASNFQDRSISQAVPSGLIADGDFGLHLREVFVSGSAAIEFSGSEELDGEPSLRWEFAVAAAESAWVVRYDDRLFAVSSRGSFWADPATNDVRRMEIRTLEMPEDVPIREMERTIDYHRVRIGEQNVLLPRTGTIIVQDASGMRHRNITGYTNCRQYVGESVINFDFTEEQPSEEAAPQITEVELPPALEVWTRLENPIRSESAAVGDPVTAVVERNVAWNGETVVPKGARLVGRIRVLERHGTPAGYRIGLEFTDVEFSGSHGRFRGSLERWQPKPGQQTVPAEGQRAGLPGVGVVFLQGASFVLPQGTLMLWVTQAAGTP